MYIYSAILFEGLLAGLWEFPSLTLDTECQERLEYGTVLDKYSLKVHKPSKKLAVGEVSVI